MTQWSHTGIPRNIKGTNQYISLIYKENINKIYKSTEQDNINHQHRFLQTCKEKPKKNNKHSRYSI